MSTPTESNGTELIIDGIAADARQQAEALIAETRKIAGERIVFARRKAENILKEARSRAEQQAAATRQTVLSGINVALKREALHAHDEILNDIIKQATGKIAALITQPEYRSLLIRWIAEAAAGLGAPAANVNASAPEREMIDAAMLEEVARYTQKLYGTAVVLSLSPDNALAEQGVVVTAANGRTAFNNQIGTRVRRCNRVIRNRVYETLLSPAPQEGEPLKQTDQS